MRNKRLIPFLALLLVLALAVSGCSNEVYEDSALKEKTGGIPSSTDGAPSSTGGTPSSTGGTDDDGNGNQPYGSDTLTVAEFIEGKYEDGAWVEGYIIGDCTKSFKYAEFEQPFTHPQAILIADSRDERTKENIVAVQLKTGYKIRSDLNLVDHPGYLGRKILLFGFYAKYLYMAGLKNVSAYVVY